MVFSGAMAPLMRDSCFARIGRLALVSCLSSCGPSPRQRFDASPPIDAQVIPDAWRDAGWSEACTIGPCPENLPYCCYSQGLEDPNTCTDDREYKEHCSEQVYEPQSDCDVASGTGCPAEKPFCCGQGTVLTFCVDHALWTSPGHPGWVCTVLARSPMSSAMLRR